MQQRLERLANFLLNNARFALVMVCVLIVTTVTPILYAVTKCAVAGWPFATGAQTACVNGYTSELAMVFTFLVLGSELLLAFTGVLLVTGALVYGFIYAWKRVVHGESAK